VEDIPIDFAIVTALPLECDAVLRHLGPYEKIQDDQEPLTYYRGQIALPGAAAHYEVVVTTLLDMGNIDAAIATTRLMHRWRPASVVMVGIAGGVPGKVHLGDIVVAEFVFYYEQAKLTPDGPQLRPDQRDSNALLYGRARAFDAHDWRKSIDAVRPDGSDGAYPPEVHFGPIASGEGVLADAAALAGLRERCPQLLAVAMEGAGVARATMLDGAPPRFLEVRGICDFADEHKNDNWQPYAADAAAAFACGLLRSQPQPPVARLSASAPVAAPLLILRGQSLRPIGAEELTRGGNGDLDGRPSAVVSLDFCDLVERGALSDPASASRRLTDPSGPLFNALARRGEAEFIFHGLLHIPLAFLAGHLVSDRLPVRLYDYHPSPGSQTWAWPDSDGPHPPFTLSGPGRPRKAAGDIVMQVSVSYPVLAAQTRLVVPRPAALIDLAVPHPARGIVRSEAQTRNYGQVFRHALDGIASHAGPLRRVHLFYAGPVALAFHLGQQISENIHPPVVVWNYHGGRYDWAIDLGAAAHGDDGALRPPSI